MAETNATIHYDINPVIKNLIYLSLMILLPVVALIVLLVTHMRVPWHGRDDTDERRPIVDYPVL